jgi:preprotein translocase subunit Sec61beta
MADNKIQMPSSGAGLTSFSDASATDLHMSPAFVVGLCVAVIIITILLNIL